MDVKAIIIIITSQSGKEDRFIPGKEWENAWRFESNNLFAYRIRNKIQYCDEINNIPENQFPIIIWINTAKMLESHSDREKPEKIKTTLENIKERLQASIDEIQVAYHDVTIDYIPNNWKAKSYSLASGNESQFQKILKSNEKGKYLDSSASFEDIFECFFLNLPKLFSLLKHRITNSFLDLDIDWQGLKQVSEKDKNKAKKYLNAVLNKNVSNYYKQKLVNLWFYLTGNKNNNLKINKTKTSLDKKQLPSEKSILDLINELDNEKKNAIKEQWCVLLNHVGLKVNNDPFNVSNISVDDNANIVKYLKNLDEMISKKSKRDINKFLGKIEKIEDGQKKITYFNFHHWYLKLGDLLESLKIFLE